MSGNLHPIRTNEMLKAGFESLPPPITGELNLRELTRIWEHCKNIAQQTETNYDEQNFLYAVLPQQLWTYFSTRQRPTPPVDPGNNPSYINGGTNTENATIRDQWQLNNKNYEEWKCFNRGLVDRFLSLLPAEYQWSFKNQQLTANPKLTFLQVFDWFYSQYGISTEEEATENTASLLDPWAPHEGMEALIDRFNKVITYVSFAGEIMTNGTLCNYFLTVIKKTGKYQISYEDWIARNKNFKTWAHLKDFWRTEHLKLHRANPTAFQYRFGGSVTEQEGENGSNVSNIMENCANQLMTGQQEATTQQQQFQQMMTAQMNTLQQQMQMQQGETAALMQDGLLPGSTGGVGLCLVEK